MIEKRLHHDCIKRIWDDWCIHSAITVTESCQDQASWNKNETRKLHTIQAAAETRSTNSSVVEHRPVTEKYPGSIPSGGSLGRMLTMGTDERQESCTDDGYNPERALSTDACKNDGILMSQVEQKSKREKESLTQPQKLGVRHTNLQSTTTLVNSKSK